MLDRGGITAAFRGLCGACADLRRARGGGVAVLTALALPPILLVALGAVQLQAIFNDKQKTQDVADAAALWGAQQLSVTRTGVDQRAAAFANAQLEQVRANATVAVRAVMIGQDSVKVTIDSHRPSFFFNLMPAGGFDTHAEATAESASLSPLCVLAMGTGGNDDVHMTATSRLEAPACLVHANKAVKADSDAMIQAQTVEAGTNASGPISPAASTGAPVIADPFAGMNLNFPFPCLLNILDQTVSASLTLPPGVHQLNYRIKNGATLTLQPGNHYFCGDIELNTKANLIGDDVALVFAPGIKLDWKDGGNVALNGRLTGAFAGFVILDSRSETNTFSINSDPISNITGAIYVPNTLLEIDGSKRAGAGSAWTVLAAKRFNGLNAADLVINANYGGTSVPVPAGVGNKNGDTRLVR